MGNLTLDAVYVPWSHQGGQGPRARMGCWVHCIACQLEVRRYAVCMGRGSLPINSDTAVCECAETSKGRSHLWQDEAEAVVSTDLQKQ